MRNYRTLINQRRKNKRKQHIINVITHGLIGLSVCITLVAIAAAGLWLVALAHGVVV